MPEFNTKLTACLYCCLTLYLFISNWINLQATLRDTGFNAKLISLLATLRGAKWMNLLSTLRAGIPKSIFGFPVQRYCLYTNCRTMTIRSITEFIAVMYWLPYVMSEFNTKWIS